MHKVKEIMTAPPITVSPETSVRDLAKLLTEHHINGVPVLDNTGNLTGIVTEADLIDQGKMLHIPTVLYFLDSVIFLENPKKMGKELKKMAGTKVKDICTRDVVTVEEDTPLDKVATLIAERHVNTLPVMREGQIVGVVGRGDLVRSFASSTPTH
ncbi:MAG: CBS domain-containing protein [Nitrospiraceae bacterium]|nr:CBS domain-containing protein [Nitrospiraceae bacterium]